MATGIKILFTVSSFTARNDPPSLLQQLAAVRGKGIEHRQINKGGASLRMHWNGNRMPEAVGAQAPVSSANTAGKKVTGFIITELFISF